MTQRIADLAVIFPQATQHPRNAPIPTSAYLVLDYDFESHLPLLQVFIPNRSHYLYADRGFTHIYLWPIIASDAYIPLWTYLLSWVALPL
jgi:hypothetical protein